MTDRPKLASAAALLLAGAIVLAPGELRAEPQRGSDKVSAEALDAEGTALLNQRRYDEACAKFGESYRLFAGNGVLLRLGLCQELQGKTASAWSTFRDAAARARAAGETQVERLASKRAAAIEPRLSRITIRLDVDADDVEQVRVTRDGVTLGRGAFGSPLPVDPGSHVIEATAPGSRKFAQTVVVGDGGVSQTVTITFPKSAATGRRAQGDGAAAKEPTAAAVDERGTESSWSTQKTLALVAGGIGLAGIATGSVFGLTVASKTSRSNDLCPSKRDCPPEAITVRDEAADAATISNVAFAVGAAGLVGGIVLWLTAPSGPPSARPNVLRVSPTFAAGQVGMRMEATW